MSQEFRTHAYSITVLFPICVPASTKAVISHNSQQYIVWVKHIDFAFMPKIIRILSKDHVP